MAAPDWSWTVPVMAPWSRNCADAVAVNMDPKMQNKTTRACFANCVVCVSRGPNCLCIVYLHMLVGMFCIRGACARQRGTFVTLLRPTSSESTYFVIESNILLTIEICQAVTATSLLAMT